MKRPAQLKHASTLGPIKLRYKADIGALTYVQKGGNQSTVDSQGVSLDSYIHAIYGLLLQRPVKTILMIGCGGGTLGTMLAGAGKRVGIVDIDKASFKLARRYFRMPRGIACHVDDGLAFLQKTRRRYDALIVDAFIGETIPAQFTGADFFAAARRCVRADGVVLMNVCLSRKSDPTADNLARGFKKAGWRVKLLDSPGGQRNAIVVAGLIKGLTQPELCVTPQTDAGRIAKELKAMKFRRKRAIR
jgi:SAM-dependent methyltransferase